MKNMKKQWKDCLEGEHEEIDTQYSRINQQVWSISYLKFQKDYTVSQHQKPTKACFEQFPGKKEQSNGFLCLSGKYEVLEIPLNLSLYWKSAAISS